MKSILLIAMNNGLFKMPQLTENYIWKAILPKNNFRYIKLTSISKDIFQGKWTQGEYDGKLYQENSTLQGQSLEGKYEQEYRLLGSIPGSGRSPGKENGNPLQYSCRNNPMDRKAQRVTVHGVTETWTQLSD